MSETDSGFQREFTRADRGDEGSAHMPWPPCRGKLRLSRFAAGGSTSTPAVHRSTYVNGPDYCGMTDNDIRGFLDGGFIWGWNQATQIHVRLGRTGEFPHPKYGEVELFRVLHRWDHITLPPGFDLSACRMTLHVEGGPAHPLRLLVYAVARDWNPGDGGVDGNNVSVPKPGEVWWGDAEFGQVAWGLPGAGFASDAHPDADTGAHALADATWSPGQGSLVFQSAALADYAADRIRHGKPVLLLLKLTDQQEDLPGCFLNLYSGEHGDSRNTARRPTLDLEWSSETEVESVAHDVFLEYGRVCEFPRRNSGGGTWAASFDADPEFACPALQVREGTGDSAGPWRRLSLPFETEGEWLQLRALAMPDPIELGGPFEAELADTWVLTGPPEEQSVRWFFESPTGSLHSVEAEYSRQYRWTVRFTPDEPGAWRYFWTQDFLPEPYRSTTGEFHVRGASLDEVVRHLTLLEKAIQGTPPQDRHALYLQFYALERDGMRLLEPEDHGGAGGQGFADAIQRVRSVLWGKPVPDPMPMQSHRLLRELNGVELLEPIPGGSRYGPAEADSGNKSKRKRGPLRRLASRLLRPPAGGSS